MSHNEKMDDALENHKYVIYMKKGAFAEPKNTQMNFVLLIYNIY